MSKTRHSLVRRVFDGYHKGNVTALNITALGVITRLVLAGVAVEINIVSNLGLSFFRTRVCIGNLDLIHVR